MNRKPNNMGSDELPEKTAKEIGNMVRDANLAILVGLLPILGLVYIWRLVQWYMLRSKYPVLMTGDSKEHAELARQFRAALPRFWFAVLLWPGVILFSIAFLART